MKVDADLNHFIIGIRQFPGRRLKNLTDERQVLDMAALMETDGILDSVQLILKVTDASPGRDHLNRHPYDIKNRDRKNDGIEFKWKLGNYFFDNHKILPCEK
jgi:hypothetical protein